MSAAAVTVLVVEDEPAIRELIGLVLARNDYACVAVESASEARAAIDRDAPDLVLLDWMLPQGSGIDLLKQLRRNPATRTLPVIMLTARVEEQHKIEGLDSGADDYITKPFSPNELVARVRAVLRRSAAQDATCEVLEVDGLRLEPQNQRVSVVERSLDMGPTEYRLLHFFMTHPERVYSRAALLDHVWGENVYIEERTVDVHIRRLRKSLEPSGHDRLIQTVRGAGYRFSTRD